MIWNAWTQGIFHKPCFGICWLSSSHRRSRVVVSNCTSKCKFNATNARKLCREKRGQMKQINLKICILVVSNKKSTSALSAKIIFWITDISTMPGTIAQVFAEWLVVTAFYRIEICLTSTWNANISKFSRRAQMLTFHEKDHMTMRLFSQLTPIALMKISAHTANYN